MDKLTWYVIIGAYLFIIVVAGILILSYWDVMCDFLKELREWLGKDIKEEK